MIHHLIDRCLSILSQHWPWILVLSVFAFILALMVMEFFLGQTKVHNAQALQPTRQQSENKEAVLKSLHRLPKEQYRILSHVQVPRLGGRGTTSMHHVVLSTYGMFVIQAQDEHGHVSGEIDAKHWTVEGQDGQQNFINPIVRNQYHVKALAKFLGLPEALFFSVVFFQSEVSFEEEPEPNVINRGLGRHILSHTAQIISPEVLSRVLMELRTRSSEQKRESVHSVIDVEQFIRRTPSAGLVSR